MDWMELDGYGLDGTGWVWIDAAPTSGGEGLSNSGDFMFLLEHSQWIGQGGFHSSYIFPTTSIKS